MNHRLATIEALSASFSSNQTVIIDLDMADPISELYLDIRGTNGTSFPTAGHPVQEVSAIEIVDGSEVLYSLDGLEAHALDIYHSGRFPRGNRTTYEALQENATIIGISFGRFLFDPLLAFDPKKFRNPQLKITFAYASGGMTYTAAKYKVIGALFDDKVITPQGFLMTKEVKNWTTTAAAHEYTELPTDYPYRKLLLQGRYNDNPPNWVFGNIKLSQDQDKKIIFDNEFLELISGIASENAYIREAWVVSGNTGATHIHVTPTLDVVGAAAMHATDSGNRDCSLDGGDGGYMGYITQVAFSQELHVMGWAPHGTLAIPMGDQNNIEDWFDPSGIGSLKMDITDGVSSATSKIFIQQLRKY